MAVNGNKVLDYDGLSHFHDKLKAEMVTSLSDLGVTYTAEQINSGIYVNGEIPASDSTTYLVCDGNGISAQFGVENTATSTGVYIDSGFENEDTYKGDMPGITFRNGGIYAHLIAPDARSGNGGAYLSMPFKTGTLATTDDISSTSVVSNLDFVSSNGYVLTQLPYNLSLTNDWTVNGQTYRLWEVDCILSLTKVSGGSVNVSMTSDYYLPFEFRDKSGTVLDSVYLLNAADSSTSAATGFHITFRLNYPTASSEFPDNCVYASFCTSSNARAIGNKVNKLDLDPGAEIHSLGFNTNYFRSPQSCTFVGSIKLTYIKPTE